MAKPPRASFWYALRAVLWSFFGLRRKRDFARDASIHPLHLVVAGLLAVAGLIGLLIVLVKLAVAQ